MATLNVYVTNIMKSCLALSYYQSHWTSVVISCLDKQCIITAEDIIIFCHDIPIEESDGILCEDFNDDCFIILHSRNDGCCVLSLKEKKILDYCKEAKEVFVDDYVNIGHDQVIFIFDDGEGEEDYYVTDYDCCLFDTRKETFCANTTREENIIHPVDIQCDGYNSAITSLKTKILSTTSLLHDANAKKYEKEELIKTTVDRLVCQSLDVESDIDDSPSLLDLLREDTYSPINQLKTYPDASPFIIHKIWHKIYHEQIIIVVEIENKSKEYLYNLSLRLLSRDANISSSSEIIFFNKLTAKDNSSKLQKLDTNVREKNCMYPTKRCTLTSSTSYPETSFSFVEFELAINYSKDNNRHYSVYVGKKKITISDLISDKSMVAEEFSDRDVKSNIAFDFVNYKKHFVLSSRISSLLSLPTTISKRLNCRSIVFGDVSVLKPIFLNAEVRFSNSPSSSDCTVYAKSKKVLRMVLSEIEKVLPADVECKMKFDLINVLLKQFYCLLKSEIDVGIRYIENQLLMIEDEYERDKDVIIIDSPKRKRSDVSNNETLFCDLFNAVLSTDRFLIGNQIIS